MSIPLERAMLGDVVSTLYLQHLFHKCNGWMRARWSLHSSAFSSPGWTSQSLHFQHNCSTPQAQKTSILSANAVLCSLLLSELVFEKLLGFLPLYYLDSWKSGFSLLLCQIGIRNLLFHPWRWMNRRWYTDVTPCVKTMSAFVTLELSQSHRFIQVGNGL